MQTNREGECMGIFKTDKRKELKQQLIDLYSTMFYPTMGLMAKKTVVKMIKKFEKDIKDAGVNNLPENYGVIVIEKLYKNDSGFNNNFINKAFADGATEEDIIEYYNLDLLQRLMVEWSEELIRYSAFLSSKNDDKLSSDEAINQVRMMLPMYGDPTDTSHSQGDDRPISPALRGRVDIYRASHNVYFIKSQVDEFSSYNAFIRAQITGGHI